MLQAVGRLERAYVCVCVCVCVCGRDARPNTNLHWVQER
jgi:hypothetical protein